MSFADRLKIGTDAEDFFELILKDQIFPNKTYERFDFEKLKDKYGWNTQECREYTRKNGDFRVIDENYNVIYVDVKSTSKISETSLKTAADGLVFAMNFSIDRDHCFFLKKDQTLHYTIAMKSKPLTLSSGDRGYSIFALEDCPKHRIYHDLPRKILSIKKRLRKERENF